MMKFKLVILENGRFSIQAIKEGEEEFDLQALLQPIFTPQSYTLDTEDQASFDDESLSLDELNKLSLFLGQATEHFQIEGDPTQIVFIHERLKARKIELVSQASPKSKKPLSLEQQNTVDDLMKMMQGASTPHPLLRRSNAIGKITVEMTAHFNKSTGVLSLSNFDMQTQASVERTFPKNDVVFDSDKNVEINLSEFSDTDIFNAFAGPIRQQFGPSRTVNKVLKSAGERVYTNSVKSRLNASNENLAVSAALVRSKSSPELVKSKSISTILPEPMKKKLSDLSEPFIGLVQTASPASSSIIDMLHVYDNNKIPVFRHNQDLIDKLQSHVVKASIEILGNPVRIIGKNEDNMVVFYKCTGRDDDLNAVEPVTDQDLKDFARMNPDAESFSIQVMKDLGMAMNGKLKVQSTKDLMEEEKENRSNKENQKPSK